MRTHEQIGTTKNHHDKYIKQKSNVGSNTLVCPGWPHLELYNGKPREHSERTNSEYDRQHYGKERPGEPVGSVS